MNKCTFYDLGCTPNWYSKIIRSHGNIRLRSLELGYYYRSIYPLPRGGCPGCRSRGCDIPSTLDDGQADIPQYNYLQATAIRHLWLLRCNGVAGRKVVPGSELESVYLLGAIHYQHTEDSVRYARNDFNRYRNGKHSPQ